MRFTRASLRSRGRLAAGLLAGLMATALLATACAGSAFALTSGFSSGGNIGPGIRVYTSDGYQPYRYVRTDIPQVSQHVTSICAKGLESNGTIRNGNTPCQYANPPVYPVSAPNCFPSGPWFIAYGYWTGTLSRPISGVADTVPAGFC